MMQDSLLIPWESFTEENQNNDSEICVCRGGEPEGSHEDAHELATPAGVPAVQPVLLSACRHHRASQDAFCHAGGMEGGTGLLQLKCTLSLTVEIAH